MPARRVNSGGPAAHRASAIRPGSIVLLHDDRPELAPNAQAVDRLRDELRRRRWSAVTASQLLARRAR